MSPLFHSSSTRLHLEREASLMLFSDTKISTKKIMQTRYTHTWCLNYHRNNCLTVSTIMWAYRPEALPRLFQRRLRRAACQFRLPVVFPSRPGDNRMRRSTSIRQGLIYDKGYYTTIIKSVRPFPVPENIYIISTSQCHTFLVFILVISC